MSLVPSSFLRLVNKTCARARERERECVCVCVCVDVRGREVGYEAEAGEELFRETGDGTAARFVVNL